MIAMFSQSITGHLIVRIWEFFKEKLYGSLFFSLLCAFSDWVSEKVRGSLIYDWLGRGVFTERFYAPSRFYKIIGFIFDKFITLLRKIADLFLRITNGSLTGAAVKWLWRVFKVDVMFAVFVGLMFVAPHERWNNLFLFFGAVIFGVWTLLAIALGEVKKSRGFTVSLSLLVFMLAVLIGFSMATSLSDALRILLFIFSSITFAMVIAVSVDTKEKLTRFMSVVLAFVALTALYGVAQRFMGVEIDEEFVDLTANEGMPGRVFSTFANPNNFAELLILFMPFFVPLFIFSKKLWQKMLCAGGFGLSLAALLMTYSRSCWVGFALAAVLFVALYDKRLLIPCAVLAAAAVPFLPSSIMNRIFTIGSMNDSSNSYRLYIWDSCLRMIRDYFVTGVGLGPGSFHAVYPGYASSIAVTAPHSHMLYLEIWLETGILGFLSFFGFMFATVKKTAGTMRRMDKELRTYAIAGLSSLLGIAFVCCAEYIWFYPRVMAAFWIVPAILIATVNVTAKSGGNMNEVEA